MENSITVGEELRKYFYESDLSFLSSVPQRRMNAEITTRKAAGILQLSESATRSVLKGLVDKGYLSVDASKSTFIYRLQQHFVE